MIGNLRPVRTAARRGVAACASVLLAAVLAHAEDAAPEKTGAPAAAPAAAPVETVPAKPAAPAEKPPAPAKKKSATPAKPAAPAPAPAKAETPAAPAAAPANAATPAAAPTAPAKPEAAASAPVGTPPPATAPAPVVTPAPVAPALGTAPGAPAPAAEAPAKPLQTPKPGSAKSAKTAKPAAVSPPAAPAPPPANVLPASSAEAEAVWRAYEKRWSETADYAAGFRQTIEVPDIGSKVESAGRFFFAKPGLVRWEYNEGPPQTVVGDGTWIWLYQPDLQQVYKIAYAKAFGRGGLVELLAGREGVSERYNVSLERPDATTVRIHLHAKAEGGGDLEVTLAADTFDLRAVKVRDSAGSTTQMTFTEPLRNKGVDRSRFTFTPPPAVDIISDNEAGF